MDRCSPGIETEWQNAFGSDQEAVPNRTNGDQSQTDRCDRATCFIFGILLLSSAFSGVLCSIFSPDDWRTPKEMEFGSDAWYSLSYYHKAIWFFHASSLFLHSLLLQPEKYIRRLSCICIYGRCLLWCYCARVPHRDTRAAYRKFAIDQISKKQV